MELTTIKQEVEIKKTTDRAVTLPLYFKREHAGIVAICRVFVDKKTGSLMQTKIETDAGGWVHLSTPLPFYELPANIEDVTAEEFRTSLDKVINSVENCLTDISVNG